jgi:hypothetical protein
MVTEKSQNSVVALTLRNPQVEALASEVTPSTGESKTEAVAQ